MTLRVALYARVSTKEQGDYGTSLDSQLAAMRQYAAMHGLHVAYEFSEDFTGTTPDRPVINTIKELAKSGKIEAILTYSRDRYARSRMAGMLLDVAFAHVKRLYVTREESLSTPQGIVRDGFDDLMHEYEVNMIRERTVRGKLERAKGGKIIGAGRSVTYGYMRVKYNNGRNTDLAIDNTVVSDVDFLRTPCDVVRRVFASFAYEQQSPIQIADFLNACNIPAPRGRIWRDKMIYTMLRKEEYLGVFYAFRYQHYKNEVTGKYNVRERPREEWIPIVRDDLCILEREVFQVVQDKLDNGRGGFVVKYDYLVNKRVKCMHGHSMSAHSATDRSGKNTRTYYTCSTNKFLLKKCDMPYFRSSTVDGAVWGWIVNLIQDPEKVLRGYKLSQEEALGSNQEALNTIEACDSLIAQAEEELAYLIEEAKQFRNNPRVKEQYRQQIEHQSQRIDILQKEKAQQEARLVRDVISDGEIRQRVETIASLSVNVPALNELELAERKLLLDILGVSVVLGVDDQGQYCDIVWHGDRERICLNSEMC